jgi:DNA-directed RNA polymerase specialized sigma24 family protein
VHHQFAGLATVTERDAGSAGTTAMNEALRSLSAEHRNAIVQAFYFDVPLQEISRGERISDSAVKARLHDALRALHLVAIESGIVG